MEEVKGLKDYLEILNRHKKIVIYPAVMLILVSSALALLLPATYKSSSLILIESQEIPNDLVRSTVTSYADQRIAVIKQKLMTTERIMAIVNKYNLYPEDTKNSPASVIVELFRSHMSVEMVQANVTDPNSGRSKRASIAFNVSFLDKKPLLAQKVANELTTEFLTENVKTRTARANETREFLKEEGDKFQRKIQLLEKKIADFKEKFNDSLPELLPYNLSMVEKLQDELTKDQNQIIILNDQILTMNIELANLDALLPAIGSVQALTPSQKLAQAKAKHASLKGKYSESHPDLKRLKREIESLESELRLEKNINNGKPDEHYKSPLFLKINSKIASAEREIKRLYARKKEINNKLSVFQKRVAETHQVKRAYEDLIRDYDNNLAKYKELRAKELQAELAQNLESENKGESFTLIEPPLVPSHPEKPNRFKIFIMGTVASVGVGIGLALLFEMLVGGVRGYNEVSRITGSSPLVVVPLLSVKGDDVIDTTGLNVKLYWIIGFFVVVTLVIVGFHYLVMDLEVLWFRLLRKISLL